MYNRKKPSKFWETVQIVLCVIGALGFGMLIAIPFLIKLDMNLAIIDFLRRH